MWGYNPGWGGWLIMSVGMVFLTVLLIVLVWALIRWINGRPPQSGVPLAGGPSALEILEQRYARGEIDEATFERMRERLQASRQPSSASWSAPR